MLWPPSFECCTRLMFSRITELGIAPCLLILVIPPRSFDHLPPTRAPKSALLPSPYNRFHIRGHTELSCALRNSPYDFTNQLLWNLEGDTPEFYHNSSIAESFDSFLSGGSPACAECVASSKLCCLDCRKPIIMPMSPVRGM